MMVRIDRTGRIVLPKQLRERLGLTPETELEAVEQPDGVLLRPVRQQPTMMLVDGFWIHQGIAPQHADWDRVLDDVREERIRTILEA